MTAIVAESVIRTPRRVIGQTGRLAAPLITELVLFNYASLPAGNRLKTHLHTFHQLDVILEGEVIHEVEDLTPQRMGPGDALLIAPLMQHQGYSQNGFRHASFKIFLSSRATYRTGSRSVHFRLPASVLASIDEAGAAFELDKPFALDRVLAAGTLALIEGITTVREPQRPQLVEPDFRRMVLPVLRPIDENPAGDWTVASMAESCNLSVDYFSKCFRRAFGQTPQQYLLEARMRTASNDLLSNPNMPIKQIAEKLGYSSVQTFTRAFKSLLGVSPAAFRASPTISKGPSSYH